jgi:hypothetical protein
MGANLIYTVEYSKIGPIFDEVEILNNTKIKLTKNTKESRYTMEFDVSLILDIFDEGAWEDIGEFIKKINSSQGQERKKFINEMMDFYGVKFEEPEDLIELYESYKSNYSDYATDLIDEVVKNLDSYSSELEDEVVFVESWI